MFKEAKEGDRITGAYALTELGAKTLNSLRSREARAYRATVLEKIAFVCKQLYPIQAEQLMKMNHRDIQTIFGGQRKDLSFSKIKELINQEKDDIAMASLESKLPPDRV
jgi:hypothetical protein